MKTVSISGINFKFLTMPSGKPVIFADFGNTSVHIIGWDTPRKRRVLARQFRKFADRLDCSTSVINHDDKDESKTSYLLKLQAW